MTIQLKINTPNAPDEVVELNDFIKEQNLRGFISKVGEKGHVPGTMSANDYLPIIEIILGSTVVAAGVKGLFDVLKNYFDLRKSAISTRAEQHKVEFSVETKDGQKVNLKFNSFDNNERRQFLETVDKVLTTKNG